MRFLPATVLALAAVYTLLDSTCVSAKKPSRPRSSAASSRRVSSSSSSSARPSKPAPVSRRRIPVEEEDFDDEDENDFGIPNVDVEDVDEDLGDDFIDEDDPYDEEPEPIRPAKNRRPAPGGRRPQQGRGYSSPSGPRKRPSRSRFEQEDDFEDDLRRDSRSASRRPPKRGPPRDNQGRRPGRSGRVVPYSRQGPPAVSSFTRGLNAIRSSMPDPSAVKDAAINSLSAARQTTSNLSSNLYREVKGLTSSELEQVMLKATRPDDTAVKGKHAERLVGVTYQISSRYDIYDAVLRKLWGKMAEKDWRTTIKALYILHRFSADGAPEHAPALKARLRELRRTRDPKRKDKYFNSKQLLAGDSSPENIKFRAFMSRYAHYVLLRVQCFGGMFDEISQQPKADKKKAPKPITSTALREEHLEAAAMLLKAGVSCQLKEGEECENTAIAVERVASDLIGLTSAVAIALNRVLKEDDMQGADIALIKKWCSLYKDELLPKTKGMVKRTSSKLDAFGLYLPSRMGTTLSPETLEKALSLESATHSPDVSVDDEEEVDTPSQASRASPSSPSPSRAIEEDSEEEKPQHAVKKGTASEKADLLEDEYEYDDEEYYDDEEL